MSVALEFGSVVGVRAVQTGLVGTSAVEAGPVEMVPGARGGRRRHLRVVRDGERAVSSVAWAPARPTVLRRSAGAPKPAARPAVRAGEVRLTLLGRRLLAGVIVVAVLWATWVLLAPIVGHQLAAQAGEFSGPTAEVVVLPGESLWSVARTAQPGADPRDTVLQIQQLNQLPDSQVFAGQRLIVPAGS